jgi:hypothetical protein
MFRGIVISMPLNMKFGALRNRSVRTSLVISLAGTSLQKKGQKISQEVVLVAVVVGVEVRCRWTSVSIVDVE